MGEVRIFGTTADEGMEIKAETAEELFALAVRGFLTILLGEHHRVNPRESITLQVEGEDPTELLVGLVNELIYLFDARKWVPCKASKVKLKGGVLKATLEGESYNPQNHPPAVEIKAATYHGAEVSEENGVWRARLIVDL